MAATDKVIKLREQEQKAAGESLLQLALRRLRRDRLTLIALTVVFLITLSAIFAPIISTQILRRDYGRTDIVNAFLPPGAAERILYKPFGTYRASAAYVTIAGGNRAEVTDTSFNVPLKTVEEAQGKEALFYVAHASPDAPRSVDIYIDGATRPAATKLVYGNTVPTDLIKLPPGAHDVTLRVNGAGPDSPPILEAKGLNLEAGKISTAVLLGSVNGTGDQALGVSLYSFDASNVVSTRFRLQFINAVYDAPKTHVLIDNARSFENLGYKESTILSLAPGVITVSASLPDARTYPLGTDDLGRDQLSRLLWGGQVSLSIGFLSALISLAIGVSIGIVAGFYGGLFDDFINWLITTINSLPLLLLLLIIVAVLRPGPFTLILVLGFLGWTGTVRLVRGETLSIRAREYIVGARAVGVPVYRIMLVHILPNLLSIVLITLALDIGGLILTESALSFLGFGINPPTPSWGNMLTNAQTFFTKGSHLVIWPGLLISTTVLCLYLIGDGLRDAFDPTLKN